MSAHVLVVDDNADNRKLLAWLLEDEDMTWVEVETAEDALACLEEARFDAVLMDVSLPGMSGAEATMLLRKQERYATLPIIAVTAHAIKGEAERILASGVSALVTKPIDEERLIELLHQLIDSTSEQRSGEPHAQDPLRR